MTDYRVLNKWEQKLTINTIIETIQPGHHKNDNSGYEWDEPEHTLTAVKNGMYCAECLMIHYNCLCSHN